jgi:glycosyltransferase involved in cell wall biosynthesis
MKNTDYSVVIPAYNAERYIDACIRSVLAQSIKPHSIFVVDDGSTDSTAIVAAKLHPCITVISTPNQGPAIATNIGIEAVKTQLIAFIDSDDLWLENKIETQLPFLTCSEFGFDAVLNRMQPFGETDAKSTHAQHSHWSRSTLLTSREAFRRVGPIRHMPNGYGEMIDWFSRAKDMGLKFHLIDDDLAYRRIHAQSMSYQATRKQHADFLTIAKLALERKKLAK